jgi:GMP synthase (glutamine-hydrolysing)
MTLKKATALRAVVVQHEPHEDLGGLEKPLLDEGFTLVRRFRTVHHDDLDAELVVVLGGPMGVGDAHEHPFLLQEQGFLAERLALARPTLGICLGAQLLAAAAGAEVFRGKNGPELGAGPVRWSAAAQQEPLFAPLGARTVVAHWHEDTFSPVPGATLLASTDRYTQQAFRLGEAWGFQFHPELTAAGLERWLDLGQVELEAKGRSLTELKATTGKLKAAEPALADFLARLAHHFARQARGA